MVHRRGSLQQARFFTFIKVKDAPPTRSGLLAIPLSPWPSFIPINLIAFKIYWHFWREKFWFLSPSLEVLRKRSTFTPRRYSPLFSTPRKYITGMLIKNHLAEPFIQRLASCERVRAGRRGFFFTFIFAFSSLAATNPFILLRT